MTDYRKEMDNKVNRLYGHVMQQLQENFPNEKILIHDNINNCDIKSRIRIACENRAAQGNRFFCTEEYVINWLCIASGNTYRFKLVTTPSLKGYTMIVFDIEKTEVISPSQVPLID